MKNVKNQRIVLLGVIQKLMKTVLEKDKILYVVLMMVKIEKLGLGDIVQNRV